MKLAQLQNKNEIKLIKYVETTKTEEWHFN